PSPAARTCLVEVLPNGVTGARHTLPDLAKPDFTLLDVPFQIGAEGPQPAAILRDRVHGIDLSRAALILTASKDLSLPGLRAAVVVTRNKALLQHLARDRFERMAMSGDPVGEVVMLFYASLLTVVGAPGEQTAKLVQIAQDSVRRAGLAELPEEETYRRVRDHLTVMAERFRRNAQTLDSPRSPVRRIPGMEPAAGYSAFAELSTRQDGFLPWVVRCGRAGLRLNPTVVHGGTSAAWDALYPDGQLLRFNLSEIPATFQQGLDLIRRHTCCPTPAPGLRKGRASP